MNTKHPIGARVTARWNDEGYPTLPFAAYVSFGSFDEERNTDSYGVDDDTIFYYVSDESELQSLMEGSDNEFTFVNYELVYEGGRR